MLTDFHSHILPGIDDGSPSVEESVAMLRAAGEQGIRRILLTPHFYPQQTTPEQFLARRERSLALLREGLAGLPEPPELLCGAEVYYYPQMSQSDALEKLAIEGTRCILVEMPASPWTDRMYRELERISSDLGLTPIIAHVDRYLGRFRDHGIPDRLAQLPVLVQANASFFLKRSTAPQALRLLRRRQIHVLGSDCHSLTDRPPNLGAAVEQISRKLGREALDWLLENEREIFDDQEGNAP